MKKYLLLVSLIFGGVAYAQQEVKFDFLDAVALKTIEVSYEYYLDNQSSVGLSALFNLEKKTADFRYNEKTMLSPFFRHYFTTEARWNFFGEAFFSWNEGDKKIETNGQETFVNYNDIAIGAAIGSKYISNGGLTIDIHGGVGRNLSGEKGPVLVPRVGLNIGYQF